MKTKKRKEFVEPEAVSSVCYEIQVKPKAKRTLCHWTQSEEHQLPSVHSIYRPKVVKVRILREKDYQRLLRLAKKERR